MNMNKTEKLLAARKKLKEFQQNKTNHSQDNAPNQQRDGRKTSLPKESGPTVESGTKPAPNFVHIAAELPQEMIKPTIQEPTESPSLINLDESTTSSPNLNLRPAAENSQVESYFDEGPEFNVSGKSPEHENPPEAPSDNRVLEKTLENDHQSRERNDPRLVEHSLSRSPPALPNFLDNAAPNDSSSSQKEDLLRMALAVENALNDTSEYAAASPPMETDHEYRNQFLSSCLQEQKHLVSELRVRASQYSSRISELEAIISTKDAEFEAKLSREINPLKEALQVHARTTGILVGEKAELTAAIEQCQSIAQRKSIEVEELTGKLKNSQSRVAELEKELACARNTIDDTRKMYQQLHLDYAELAERHSELRKSKEDDELEASELRRELSLKNAEASNLQRDLEEKNTLLSLNDLKIQQLTTNPHELEALESEHRATIVLEQQLSQLREALKSVSDEKEEAAKQYESYVRQLEARHEKTTQELEESKKKIEPLEERERSYIQRLSDLEQSLQRERETAEKLKPLQAHEPQIDFLTKSLDALNLEHSALQSLLNEKDSEIETLRRDIEELRLTNEDTVDKSRLVSALESEQLGASRAVSQNQQLKAQLNEMHDAFVALSNSKLDLTEQLQAERTIGRKLNAQLNKVENEVDELENRLKKKEATLLELENEKLQAAQIADQMQHYQAQSQQARTLQQELQNALGCIEILRRENQQLSVRLSATTETSGEKNLSNGDDAPKDEMESARLLSDKAYSTMKAYSAVVNPVPDPLKKLEIRFRETMERVAELTDEKQRLEHLVLQLQGETETIGEYITLYQKQRAILQRKAEEKEQTFRLLVEQRNHQQEQLHKLKVLVADLLRTKEAASSPTANLESPIIEFENECSEENHLQGNHRHDHGEEKKLDNAVDEAAIDAKENTTSKILNLLTEIKDCKETCTLEPNFHPCPWCSGKLITV